ncbi:DoxX family protein [Pseudomonas sp. DTU_2021_1001937_2_SI_NGA_ILE_001]|uniref:DoxX family protein n=1 Tax=Pseudomonas sp. DTU_2021_1001937_2_SI_NGA_ILE_001 TaxID=3077589 RepID=UPI0025E6B216|nr:DoxX family protein [Pseudomonas sp. DTU_2021_1001937_2_SI_NGA_ILE_001]WNW12910.1 DoxX family protein [Pseudomonas sp. DTU_2021_1001937_2_SI_NGA_ILE_001]
MSLPSLNPRTDAQLVGLGLLFMRVSAALLMFSAHGLPKLLNWSAELQRIEDPLGLGPHVTLLAALFAQVLCPALIALGIACRLACLPILFLLLVALLLVHPDWTLEQSQFGWLFVILFGGLLITGPGPLVVRLSRRS